MFAVLPTLKPGRPDLSKIDRNGDPEPNANVLTDGFRTPIPSVPEDARAVNDRGKYWFYSLNPRNDFHGWLVQDIALITLRLDGPADRTARARWIALRADLYWDDDRRLMRSTLGSKIGGDPAATVAAFVGRPTGATG